MRHACVLVSICLNRWYLRRYVHVVCACVNLTEDVATTLYIHTNYLTPKPNPHQTNAKQANVYYAKSPEQPQPSSNTSSAPTNNTTTTDDDDESAAAAAATAAGAGEGGGGELGGAREYAVKVFKTSILVFKDRDRYVSGAFFGGVSCEFGGGWFCDYCWGVFWGGGSLESRCTASYPTSRHTNLNTKHTHPTKLNVNHTGEFRFRHGYCRSNPRKMVKLWAEKEMRNLKR